MILKLALDLPDDQSFVPLARQLGRSLLEYMKVVKEDISDVEGILTELATNVVLYAQSYGGRFKILLEYYSSRMVITVVDEGDGFTFKDLPDVGTVRPDGQGGLRIGGFGMSILEGLSDRISFTRTDPHGTTACSVKELRYETQKASEDADDMNGKDGMIRLSQQ